MIHLCTTYRYDEIIVGSIQYDAIQYYSMKSQQDPFNTNSQFGKKSKRRSPFGLFESCREKQISLCFMKRLRKLIHFGGRMGLRMKLIAKKELILLFQMTPSRILCDQQFWSYEFLNLFLFFCIFRVFPKNKESSQLKSV